MSQSLNYQIGASTGMFLSNSKKEEHNVWSFVRCSAHGLAIALEPHNVSFRLGGIEARRTVGCSLSNNYCGGEEMSALCGRHSTVLRNRFP